MLTLFTGCLNSSKLFYSSAQVQNVTNANVNSILAVTAIKNPWIWQKQTSIESPLLRITPLELPKSIFWIPPKSDPVSDTEIQDPTLEINKHEKQAVKLIVIRRHKMRKHKLKKLRKKMKFEWAKVGE